VDDCLNPELPGLFELPRSEVVESFEASDRDEDRGLKPGRGDPDWGVRVERRGNGEYDRGWVFDGEGCPAKRSSHILLIQYEDIESKLGRFRCLFQRHRNIGPRLHRQDVQREKIGIEISSKVLS
jgi:hypothetical protein